MLSDNCHVIDTAVLLYFLLVKEEVLLGDLLGWPLRVPLAVYDPEDQTSPPGALPRSDLLSEMRQAVRHYERVAGSNGDTESLMRVSNVDTLYEEGRLVIEAMSTQEQRFADGLQGTGAAKFELRAPLGPGGAACVAIAFERRWTLITEDSDALSVLARLRPKRNYRYEQIRELLMRAANEDLITSGEANQIYTEMVSYGFWGSRPSLPIRTPSGYSV